MDNLSDVLVSKIKDLIASDRDMIADMLKSGERAVDIQINLNIVAKYENVLRVFEDDQPISKMAEYQQKIFLEMIDRILDMEG